jgi:Holliday junction resolvase RusA-like endonuclease
MIDSLRITATGQPVGQGAMRRSPNGPGMYHANAAALKRWRRTIGEAALLAARGRPGWPLDDLPVAVEATITVALTGVAGRAISRTGTAWPANRHTSDVDHYARAVLDALTKVLWRDDSQVVELTCRKVYPGQGIDALDVPGAVIIVQPLVPVQPVLEVAL